MKKCIICNNIKELHAFVKRKDSLDGYRNYCKSCRYKKELERRKRILKNIR